METITRNMPVLALRGLTAFPGQTMSFDAERDISIFALDNAMENDRRLLAVTQRELSTAEPGEEELYTIGTVCHILQIIKTSDTTVRVIVEGECRARLHRLWQKKPFLQAQAELLPETESRHTARSEALIRRTYVLFGEYRELVGSSISDDFSAAVLDCGDTGRLADLITQNINLRHQDRQRVLEELHPDKRLRIVNDILTHEVDVLSLESEMEQKVRMRVAQVQKDMILREQVKVLQHELGDDGDEEIEEYTARIEAAHLPDEVHKKLTKEVERLAKQPFGSAEASVIRNYLDVCLELPWNKSTRERADGAGAENTGQGALRAGQGEGTGAGVHRRAAAESGRQGEDPVSGGASRRGQDLRGHVRGAGYEPQVRAAQSGRCAGRGRHPGTPENVHRRHAGTYHRGAGQGGYHEPAAGAG